MNTPTKAYLAGCLLLIALFGAHSAYASDLNTNGVQDATESSVIVSTNQTLEAGEYVFNDLVISDGAVLTLRSDPESAEEFKGVQISANSIFVGSGSYINADNTGYITGPGFHDPDGYGASHGGSSNLDRPEWSYGKALTPTDLGSGASGRAGGGAIMLDVTNQLTNQGVISANGTFQRTSGGSIYVRAGSLAGTGMFTANGGNVNWPGRYAGGGGRIAVYFGASTFTGTLEARAGNYCFYGCAPDAEHGTAIMVHTTTNDVWIPSTFRFQASESPFSFRNIYINNTPAYNSNASVVIGDGVRLNASSIIVDRNAHIGIGDALTEVPTITLDNGSMMTVTSGKELGLDTLNIINGSTVTAPLEKVLSLQLNNLTIGAGGRIDVNGKGYGDNGPGSTTITGIGASYGGVGGNGGAPVYGSASAPVDLGSGTPSGRGGGAVRIDVANTFNNNGHVWANGTGYRSSGGSIYVTTQNLIGSGEFAANAPNMSWPNNHAGGGGRVAIFYDDSAFTGTTTAQGGRYCFDGCLPAGGEGTVTIDRKPDPNAPSNVMFIPGHMASRLYEDLGECTTLINPCGEKQLWFSINNNLQSRMALDTNGDSVNSVYTIDDTQHETPNQDETGILDEVFGINIYKSFLTDMQSWKDDGVINDYEFIPYDWRLSIEDVVTNGRAINGKVRYTSDQSFGESYILHKLRELQRTSKSGKVTIITHSNGGLVAKTLIKKLKETNDPLYNQIDQLILVASPQIGTPEAAIALLHGTELQNGFVMSAERSRALAENMTSAYTLLPSQAYYTSVFGDMFTFPQDSTFAAERTRYGESVSTFAELQDYLRGVEGRIKPDIGDTDKPNVVNSQLLTTANTTHGVIDFDALPPTTQVIQIAGWGLETLSGLDYTLKSQSDGTTTKSFRPRFTTNGDGTVVEPSALWIPDGPNVERWWVNLPTSNEGLVNYNREHKDILEVNNLRAFMLSKIRKDSIYSDSEKIVTDTQPTTSLPNRLHFVLHSPLTLGIRDTSGNYSGRNPTTGEVDSGVPGATYGQIGDVQYLSAPNDARYTVELDGQGAGVFALDIQSVQGDTVLNTTTYQAIPTTPSTMVTIPILPNQDIDQTVLSIDSNADGAVDVVLPAVSSGVTYYDQMPPELQILFDINKLDVVATGSDKVDPKPVLAMGTSAITITDSAGNTTTVPLKRYRDTPTRFRIVYDSIIRNGVTTAVPQTSILYTWNTNKKGTLTDLNTRVSIRGIEKYVYDYRKQSNTTIVTNKTKRVITQTTLPGMLTPTVTTEGKSVVVKY